ncbi:MAG TPA: malto-oligosyltrehalose synthase [Mycobacterium sp.]|nr:malto-oligosyltrehalose synthase [Mycobacterium sp.]
MPEGRTARPVLSTYRLQLRGDCFKFGEAEKLLDYLDELGISHLYLSPILTAVRGSTHGYDVTDPTVVSEALGGVDGLAALAVAAQARGMGLIVDIVPNHLGVDPADQNPWWWDVLRCGRDSAYARFFDIDWAPNNGVGGKLALPLLDSDDDSAGLVVDGDALRLGSLVVPIAPGAAAPGLTGPEVHDRQHYRLVGWRRGVCGYRRFFAVNSLAGLRQEDREVFDATHVEVRRWLTEGLVDAVRVDHLDGLSDPVGYLRWLRELAGPQAWIVVEKILAVDEPLDPTLPVAGTTGYDALLEIGGLFVDPAGETALTRLFESTGLRYDTMPALARELKAATATNLLASDLHRLCRAITSASGADHPRLAEAVAGLVSHIGSYRCDYPGLSLVLASATAQLITATPELAEPLQIVATAMARADEPAVRLQQLCEAATAKSMEDCLFYRDARLVSLNEVGGKPGRFGVSTAEFHERALQRARMWPLAMTTLTTHDTKRGEDVRARIGVLSQVPSRWAELVTRWQQRAPAPDPVTGLFLLQNVFGVWPLGGAMTAELRDRLHGYAQKALREAGSHTSWHDPDPEFESAVHAWLETIIAGPIAAELTSLVAELDPHGRNDSLGQKLLQLTAPGIPDVYQGTELWEDSLVDPDNRRPVDYAPRRAALAAMTHPKIKITASALQLRRSRPETFLYGGYTPIQATGAAQEHLVGFRRGDEVLVAVSRWTVRLAETGWKDTLLVLPDGSWTDRLTGRDWTGSVLVADLFGELPVALLERPDA